jgi:hypothetical protein
MSRNRRDTLVSAMRLATLCAAVIAMFPACGGESKSSDDDTRTRHDELHITIHQDAGYNSPIIGWAVENGTPGDGKLRTDARFLELTVLGNAEHPTNCALAIEHAVTDQLDENPASDDPILIGDENPKVEHSYTIPCSETPDSTTISWPDGSIVMTGHIDDSSSSEDNEESSSGDNPWSFRIDHIKRAPRITKFDPEDSFTWGSPSPEPT